MPRGKRKWSSQFCLVEAEGTGRCGSVIVSWRRSSTSDIRTKVTANRRAANPSRTTKIALFLDLSRRVRSSGAVVRII